MLQLSHTDKLKLIDELIAENANTNIKQYIAEVKDIENELNQIESETSTNDQR